LSFLEELRSLARKLHRRFIKDWFNFSLTFTASS